MHRSYLFDDVVGQVQYPELSEWRQLLVWDVDKLVILQVDLEYSGKKLMNLTYI